MSPSRRFRVSFVMTRNLFIELNAPDERVAEEIAKFVLNELGQSHFSSTPEDIFDTVIEDTWMVQS